MSNSAFIRIAALIALFLVPALAISIATATLARVAEAQVMQSPSYSIQADSINVGGGLSDSASYSMEDTAGEVATGYSSSASYNLHAGYQQMDQTFVSLSSANDVSLFPSIDNAVGGTANGSASVVATTNSSTGYQLFIEASSSPAMVGSAGAIADYVTAGADPDFTFAFAAPDAFFGFSPEGSDIVARYQDDGVSCNTGALDTALACWEPLATATTLIAEDAASNFPGGATTTLRFRLGVGATSALAAGTYVATATVTMIAI